MNAGASSGRMPANVSERERATVIAGFAKEVEAVNQYAAPIHAATIHGASSLRRRPRTTMSNPNVATPSERHWGGSRSGMERVLDEWQFEHSMGQESARATAHDLD